jgi:hypothetical protein
MLVTDDPRSGTRAWSYKDHGKSYDAVFNREHAAGFRWLPRVVRHELAHD